MITRLDTGLRVGGEKGIKPDEFICLSQLVGYDGVEIERLANGDINIKLRTSQVLNANDITEIASPPYSFYNISNYCIVGNKVYFGARQTVNQDGEHLLCYDISNNTWYNLLTIPSGTNSCRYIVHYNGYLYFVTGAYVFYKININTLNYTSPANLGLGSTSMWCHIGTYIYAYSSSRVYRFDMSSDTYEYKNTISITATYGIPIGNDIYVIAANKKYNYVDNAWTDIEKYINAFAGDYGSLLKIGSNVFGWTAPASSTELFIAKYISEKNFLLIVERIPKPSLSTMIQLIADDEYLYAFYTLTYKSFKIPLSKLNLT